MTNIFYLCTRLTYGIAEYFHKKGYGSPLCVEYSAYHRSK